MSETLRRIQSLIRDGEFRISAHGYDELADDGMTAREIVEGSDEAVVVEDYPAFTRGPAVLVLQRDVLGRPLHVVWGIAKGTAGPAVLVTAYRPDPRRWSSDFMRRRS